MLVPFHDLSMPPRFSNYSVCFSTIYWLGSVAPMWLTRLPFPPWHPSPGDHPEASSHVPNYHWDVTGCHCGAGAPRLTVRFLSLSPRVLAGQSGSLTKSPTWHFPAASSHPGGCRPVLIPPHSILTMVPHSQPFTTHLHSTH